VAVDQGPPIPVCTVSGIITLYTCFVTTTGIFIEASISDCAGKYVDNEPQSRAGRNGHLHVSTAPGFISTSTSAYSLYMAFFRNTIKH
jgi:hypothetical protein